MSAVCACCILPCNANLCAISYDLESYVTDAYNVLFKSLYMYNVGVYNVIIHAGTWEVIIHVYNALYKRLCIIHCIIQCITLLCGRSHAERSHGEAPMGGPMWRGPMERLPWEVPWRGPMERLPWRGSMEESHGGVVPWSGLVGGVPWRGPMERLP